MSGIQKYVYLAVLQTTVFSLKPQKEVYLFGSPGSNIFLTASLTIQLKLLNTRLFTKRSRSSEQYLVFRKTYFYNLGHILIILSLISSLVCGGGKHARMGWVRQDLIHPLPQKIIRVFGLWSLVSLVPFTASFVAEPMVQSSHPPLECTGNFFNMSPRKCLLQN